MPAISFISEKPNEKILRKNQKILGLDMNLFKIVLIKMVLVLMSAKLTTLDLLRIKVFWNKDYDVMTSVHDVTSKILSRDSNYILDLVMWSNFYERSYHKLQDLTWKTTLFKGWSWFKYNNLGLALGVVLKFYTSVARGLKVKVTQFLGLILALVEVTGERLVRGFSAYPHPERG